MRALLPILFACFPLLTFAASPVTLQGVQFHPRQAVSSGTATLALSYSPHSPLNVLNGDGVSQLTDLSGGVNHLSQAVAASQPLLTNINGRAWLWFDGTNDYLKSPAVASLVQPTLVCLGVEQVTWTSGEYLFDGNTTISGGAYQSTANPGVRINSGTPGPLNNDLMVGNAGILLASFSGVSSAVTVNRRSAVSDNAGSSAMSGFTLGSRGAVDAAYGNIRTHDINIYQGTLTDPWQHWLVYNHARLMGVNPYAQ